MKETIQLPSFSDLFSSDTPVMVSLKPTPKQSPLIPKKVVEPKKASVTSKLIPPQLRRPNVSTVDHEGMNTKKTPKKST